MNLGLFQHDVNVIWDLAPHDLSIMDYLISDDARSDCGDRAEPPERTRRHGVHHALFPEQLIAHINVNWLSPVKVRTTLIGGEKKMLVWNDLEADEKIKVYDKGVNVTSQQGTLQLAGELSLRATCGRRRSNRIEALRTELQLLRRLHQRQREAIQRRNARDCEW